MSVAEELHPASNARVRFPTRRLGHANIFVADADKTADFYINVAGIEECAREPHIPAIFITNGNTHHDYGLVQCGGGKELRGRDGHLQRAAGRGREPGLNHLGWEMENERLLVAAHDRAVAMGLPLHRRTDHTISHSIYVFDPDGHLHEMYADVLENWRTVLNGALPSITGEWKVDAKTASSTPLWGAEPYIRQVPKAPFHPIRIARAVFVSNRLDPMRQYYTNVLGLEDGYDASDGSFFTLRGHASAYDVAFFKAAPGQKPRMVHTSLLMPSERSIDEGKRALKSMGKGDRIVFEVDNAAKKSVFLRDPDGLGVEFFVERAGGFAGIGDHDLATRPYYA